MHRQDGAIHSEIANRMLWEKLGKGGGISKGQDRPAELAKVRSKRQALKLA